MRTFCLALLFMIVGSPGLVRAQCGPDCPACSGSSESGIATGTQGSLQVSLLYIPEGEEEPAVTNLGFVLTDWLSVGVGYAVEAEELLWNVRLQPVREDVSGWRPHLILGTGSVQMGGSDQSVFARLGKSYEFRPGYSARVSGGIAGLTPDFERGYALAGLTLTLAEQLNPFVNYDGLSGHLGLAWTPLKWLSLSGLWIEMEEFGLAVSWGWNSAAASTGE